MASTVSSAYAGRATEANAAMSTSRNAATRRASTAAFARKWAPRFDARVQPAGAAIVASARRPHAQARRAKMAASAFR